MTNMQLLRKQEFMAMGRLLVAVLSLCIVPMTCAMTFAEDLQITRPNIVFIMSDDHCAQAISAYGGLLAKIAPTPNLDRLAQSGTVFNRAYCQEPIWMSSRASLMSGLRPDTLGIFANKSLDEHASGVLTINQHF